MSFFPITSQLTLTNACNEGFAQHHLDAANQATSFAYCVHYLIGSLEEIPVLGRIISLIECILAKILLCCPSEEPAPPIRGRSLPDEPAPPVRRSALPEFRQSDAEVKEPEEEVLEEII